ncbi:hypothetical protein GCM10010415_39510 [Streptomyces atrovirens]
MGAMRPRYALAREQGSRKREHPDGSLRGHTSVTGSRQTFVTVTVTRTDGSVRLPQAFERNSRVSHHGRD